MIRYTCDGCGKQIAKNALRYTVKIDVRAAYDILEVGLMDLVRDHRAELLRLIESMKHKQPEEIEESVYKCIALDLCPSCQRAFISRPLAFRPDQDVREPPVNIDAFLRSLGYGTGRSASEDE
ncbi:MAG: hypothetical protein HZB26_16340 [Candidatus Hydrogenedentes bacterium]|nr:hypothetical protein [Candidatus Hydrogenedentota bacterium]